MQFQLVNQQRSGQHVFINRTSFSAVREISRTTGALYNTYVYDLKSEKWSSPFTRWVRCMTQKQHHFALRYFCNDLPNWVGGKLYIVPKLLEVNENSLSLGDQRNIY